MECPYCKKVMVNGYFHNGSTQIQWIPKGNKPSIFRFGVAENVVLLKNTFLFSGYKSEAYYCSNCKIILSKTD